MISLLTLPLVLAPIIEPMEPVQDPVLDIANEQRKYLNRRSPVVRVVEAATPAVVYIKNAGIVHTQDFWGRPRAQRFNGSGSGVVILKEGFIVTNYHVVKNADRITVSFDSKYDENVYDASLVSYVEAEDLALLKIDEPGDFPTVPMGTSSDLMPGEMVVAIGNPYGQTHTVSTGIISGLHRNVKIPASGLVFDDLIQTDASINLGNSGGPLLNINGELIGINTALNTEAENIGFAIPVDRVVRVLEDELLSPEAERAWLGFYADDDDPLRVDSVLAGGPAAAAGLREGDVILSVDGTEVHSDEDLRLARLGLRPWRKVPFRIQRNGRLKVIDLQTWDKLDGLLFERLGLTVEPVVLGRKYYVRVASVGDGGPAEVLGLEPGDLIDAVRPTVGNVSRPWRIRDPKALASLVDDLSSGTELELDIFRDVDGNNRYDREELYRGSLEVR